MVTVRVIAESLTTRWTGKPAISFNRILPHTDETLFAKDVTAREDVGSVCVVIHRWVSDVLMLKDGHAFEAEAFEVEVIKPARVIF